MIKINLLPRKPKPLIALWRDGAILGVVVLILVFMGLVVMVKMNNRLKMTRKELQLVKKQIEDSKLDLEKVDKLKKQKSVLENKINIISSLRERQAGPVHVLDDLSVAIPEQVWLDSLLNMGNILHLGGLSPSYNAVSEFMRQLALSPYFSNIELVNIQQKILKNRKFQQFRISCRVRFIPPPHEDSKEGNKEK
jgi:type IV pilus assembly protein PilN